jgi:ABC-type multidrug transport system fused ATPase/permease subunit
MLADSPYPGLRPFNRDEADIFFGREAHVDAMVDRLAKQRLLAVTGNSGCGKSSLVRAGLLAALETGLLAAAGPVWRFAICTPREHPMTELATALLTVQGEEPASEEIALRRAELEIWPLSLAAELRRRPLSDGANLLIVVDQFEELFRYQDLSGREEAETFIALLLTSASQRDVPIYIVLTMRSDFLGRCAEFTDLAEAISDAQYLCPRLNREQIAAAIEGPARVFGGAVEELLLARLVNDMGTDPDQLPLMQHALMRLWNTARVQDPTRRMLRLSDYVEADGLKGSLSHHADEILAEVAQSGPWCEETTRRMFCLLVDGEGEKAVRRPVTLAEIMAVADCSLNEITRVADAFRGVGRTFLNPGSDHMLKPDTALDISHECLIRQWQVLRAWLVAEAVGAELYRETERRARRWAAGRALETLWDPTDLELTLAWRDREHPNAAWAKRYGGDFDLTIRFLDESRERRDAAVAERREQERLLIVADEAVARQQAEAEVEDSRIAREDARVLGKRLTETPLTPSGDPSGLEPTLYRFILRHSLGAQILLLVLALVSFPFLYYSLLLPKKIIDGVIEGGKHFPQHILGFELDQISYLMVLCAAFLGLVFISGGFKYYINTFKGRLGERMLRRFRDQLYYQMLRFPLAYFHKNSSAQIIPMITVECEQLGGFIGDAFVTPLSNGGQLLTNIFFMFMMDPILGLAAVALYPVQGFVIPKLQFKVNQLARRRVRTIRQVADRVQESATGIADILANDTVKLQRTGFAHLLGTIYDIRFESYQRKFFVKFLSNFMGQLTPFFFFSMGGYLVLKGQLSVGALAAVLLAQRELAAPWNELLGFYQIFQTSKITYEQIIEQFHPTGMIDARLLEEEQETVQPLSGVIAVDNLSLVEDDLALVIDSVSFTMHLDEHVAIIGQGGSGKNELALLLARLLRPTKGRITIGSIDLAGMPIAVTGRRIGYVGVAPYLFAGTLRDNLLLGLRHRPIRPANYDPVTAKRRSAQISEARRSGNIDFDIHADWLDYESAGVDGDEGLSARIAEVLARLDFDEFVYALGLRWRLDPEADPVAAVRLLEARKALARRLVEDGITKLVETYDADRFNLNASVAENLLFGTPIGPAFDFEALADNSYLRQVLTKVGLIDDLVEAGRQVAEMMIELFAGLPPDHEFFEQFSFVSADDLPEFVAILGRIGADGPRALPRPDRAKLLSLPFRLIPARHRLDVLDDAMQNRLLEARRVFRADLPAEARSQIEFFDAERYSGAASVQDNILFGKIAYGEADAPVRVPSVVAEVVDELSLRQTIIEVGLDYNVGSGGSRLSFAERQKAGIAREVLKRPDLLILNESTSALDGQSQSRVTEGLKEEFAGRGIVWVLHRPGLARGFDRILEMSNGKLTELEPLAEVDREIGDQPTVRRSATAYGRPRRQAPRDAEEAAAGSAAPRPITLPQLGSA